MYRVIAFYTKDTQYEELVNKLTISCQKFSTLWHTEAFKDRGKWEHNCAIKPEFILEMLHQYPDETLIYIDADALIQRQPELFETFDGDFACHYRNGELLSGTLFFKSNAKTIELVRRWFEKQQEDPNIWDQKVLQEVIKDSQDLGLELRELPATYCKIFDARDQFGLPVIEHFQASRKVKAERRKRKEGRCNLPKNARIQPDGSMTLLRRKPKDIAFMDQNFKRRHPSEMRWFPELETMEEAALDFEGKTAYIIGKGPSLDRLSEGDFKEDGPIIAINESIIKAEELDIPNPLFLIQDPSLREFAKPQRSTLILEESIRGLYRLHPKKIQYSRKGMELPPKVLSAIVAIHILKSWNIAKIIFISFDACINQNTGYAKIVGYASNDKKRNPDRFLKHKAMLLKNLGNMSHSFRLAGCSD